MSEQNDKEFKKKEILLELKIVAFHSIDDFNSLKESIIQKIKDRALNYNFEYIKKEINEKGFFNFHNTNSFGYYKGRLSEYKKISQKQKDFMNKEVSKIRNSINQFTKEQEKRIDEIYTSLHKKVEDLFNNSEIFTEKHNCSFLQYQLKKMEEF